jgi:glycine cleavage system H protein
MKIPADLRYTKDHEWAKIDGGTATFGITDYAQDALGDIVFLELPTVGASFKAGDALGVVESVKAVSDIFAPLSGEVTAVNEELTKAPETINTDAYAAWMVKIKIADPNEAKALMDAAAYKKLVAEVAK